MKASEANFLRFLQDTKQFVIPIYQRTYSWTLKQCEQLWGDVLRASKNETVSAHFVGSIVYIERGLYQISSVPQLLVIDGQQRLTTLTLMISALGRAIEQNDEPSSINRRRLNNYYLFNSEEDGDLRYKLLLTQADRETLLTLLDERELPETYSIRVLENFRYFENQIANASASLDSIFQGIQKLTIVDIALNRDHDNPQLIFESLNSTGLELTQADLIRNYMLMGINPKDQERLYNDYWYPMEQSFGQEAYAVQFDPFMRHYLTIKTGRIPNIGAVYESFKNYAQSRDTGSIEEIVSDVRRFSRYYVNLALEKERDPRINELARDLNRLRVDVSYPFLLELHDDYEAGVLSRDDFVTIMKLVESYVIRRAICGIPTNSLNKTFANLAREIDKTRHVESVKARFLAMKSNRRFPDDEEFRREFVIKDIYNLTNRRNYLLRKLENHGRKEPVDVESYTIEHIMPQNENLSQKWVEALGENWREAHRAHLHTIGNLTLTGYNPELRDRPFLDKRDMEGGFRDSPLRLNSDLAKLTTWNADTIRERAERLATRAIEIWPGPWLEPEILARYQKSEHVAAGSEYTLADHIHLTGETRRLFDHLRTRIFNLDSEVREEILKLYIAYKTTTNFVDVVPQASGLRLSLNMEFHEIDDPRRWCKDVSNVGRWGNGDVEVRFTDLAQIEYIMFLINQAYAKHTDMDVEWSLATVSD